MARWRRRCAALRTLAVLSLSSGCATEPVPRSLQLVREVAREDYDEVLRRWTQKDVVYEGLDSKLFVWATFHSPEFRRAFMLRHTDVYGSGSEEASRLLLTSPEAEESLEFFFSASTSSPQWNDFEKETSIWRVSLEGDDHERVDGRVEKLKPTANLRVIYPYITDYARTYTVRFPRVTVAGQPVITAASRRFTLRMASALGTAELVWVLAPSKAKGAGRGDGAGTRSPLPDRTMEGGARTAAPATGATTGPAQSGEDE